MEFLAASLLLLLMPPELESRFCGAIPDTNGNLVHLEIKTKSVFCAGMYHMELTGLSDTEGLIFHWPPGGMRGPVWTEDIGAGMTTYPSRLNWKIHEGFVTVTRGDVLIFQMHAPTYRPDFGDP